MTNPATWASTSTSRWHDCYWPGRRQTAPELRFADALVLLGCLLQDALAGARAGSAIEILALEALALYASGNTTAALVSLERALPGAEPEGYGRLLIDEGQRCQTHPAVG